ncbi:trifunctional hydroxymethylpyrimidine kinase/phosphomethylpyrimidine kinase/thiaminase [Friedmanniomyces endolithicus]|uniref:Trifunctional hydroxymethylpyrimidine kinase/phosphomethylpyrimidine kinase/thiaminase n=1 Tax=Friedmanniomyces endolithicus TaxID=329885 RepID=A0AAN6J0J0_9PEZI|nr:trifunctional hydroxymethylpyrimidine kinase/phosphomethylpyrimidine kinase/thiaminase [Friedmanniomyces endolithicus]KAK0977294.1 trifunctional hydroxymethylpyrimidine kinase/phosphomethylpyrimidine kinase/thiaminase [Friedmanniomyces endolithicus]
MTATTALTAQNTQGVHGIHEVPSEFVRKQISACVEDIGVDVVKTGMLASAGTVSIVADALREYSVKLAIVDPVMVATSGARLLPEDAVKTLCERLLPNTFLVTPNIPEARLMLEKTGRQPVSLHDVAGLKQMARAVHELGPKYVLLKGGHLPLTADRKVAGSEDQKSLVANVLYGDDVNEVFELEYQHSRNTHGTGCTLASAIACHLANGAGVANAVRSACRYVEAGIKMSVNLGKGSGPLNHFHSMQISPFPPGGFVDYVLQREDVKIAWHEYTHHEFVQRMGDGTLPPETFKSYMIQDYLYLVHFARANALAGYKAKAIDDVAGAAAIVTHIRNEIDLHIDECKQFGLSQAAMDQCEESEACTAYSRYILDIGNSEDWLALQVSLLPCLLGYWVIARRLQSLQASLKSPNRYATWINNYVGEDYTAAVIKGRALIEKHAARQSPSRVDELVAIFIRATKVSTTPARISHSY